MECREVSVAASIRSFLVYVAPGTREQVTVRLRALPGCDVLAAENRDVIIVVAEVDSSDTDDTIQDRIAGVSGVVGVSLVAGFAE